MNIPNVPKTHAIFDTDLTKPCSVLVEEIRNQMSRTRGQISDIIREYGFKDNLICAEGLLTCGISALANSNETIREVEIKRLDNLRGPSLKFNSRGIGVEHGLGCFVCGTDRQSKNLSAFIRSKEEGQTIVEWFGIAGARLDFRPHEPNWIQVKVGVCDEHIEALEELDKMTSLHGRIRQQDIIDCRNLMLAKVR